jgi:hypothetical protein
MTKKAKPDALAAEAAEVAGKPATFEALGQTWTVAGLPNPLLISEMAATDADDPEAIGIIADFFRQVLGDGYPKFRRAFFAAWEPGDDETLSEILGAAMEAAFGRPKASS